MTHVLKVKKSLLVSVNLSLVQTSFSCLYLSTLYKVSNSTGKYYEETEKIEQVMKRCISFAASS